MQSDSQLVQAKQNMFEDGRFGFIALLATPITVALVMFILAL